MLSQSVLKTFHGGGRELCNQLRKHLLCFTNFSAIKLFLRFNYKLVLEIKIALALILTAMVMKNNLFT